MGRAGINCIVRESWINIRSEYRKMLDVHRLCISGGTHTAEGTTDSNHAGHSDHKVFSVQYAVLGVDSGLDVLVGSARKLGQQIGIQRERGSATAHGKDISIISFQSGNLVFIQCSEV